MIPRISDLKLLQSGGSADLYVGRRNDTGQQVVVKFLREYHLEHARRTFAREVRILERKFRGVMPILFSNTETERPFYVMPYMSGGSLTTRAGTLTVEQLCAVAAELALTLDALHSANIEHGDVKPDNVQVCQHGQLHVADPLGNGMGCTVLFSQNHGGTPGYWAPEVRAGQPISRAGDVYSFGATLCHLLTGIKPQDGRGVVLSLETCAFAPMVSEIILACCQPTPADRPTMKEVLRILRGERWSEILDERKQRKEFWTAAALIGSVILAGKALSS